jgi:hypothetical protein
MKFTIFCEEKKEIDDRGNEETSKYQPRKASGG